MREFRFRVEHLSKSAPARLVGNERRHAVDVCRLTIGEKVRLFDDDGNTANARITAIEPDAVILELLDDPILASQNNGELTLVVAAPKQKRADWLVEKCAELGVDCLYFLETKRGEVLPGPGRVQRWEKKVIEAAKQSGALPVMRVRPPISITEILKQIKDQSQNEKPDVIFGTLSPDAESFIDFLNVREERTCPLFAFVGPEGGWTDEEIAELKDTGAVGVLLNANTLRIETAAIAFAAIWAAAQTEP